MNDLERNDLERYDLQRKAAFERRLLERLAGRIEPFRWGRAFLDDRFPKRWDSNFLWVEASLDDVSPGELAAEADRVLGGAGLEHRQVYMDDDAGGARVAPGLAALGFEPQHLATMAARREPDRWSSTPTEEVGFKTIRPALVTILRREPFGGDEETVRMLADYRQVAAETVGARFFVARVDGRIVSACELYVDGDVAQIEDVNTLEEFRRRGLARAVVLRAVDEARAAGCDLVFLHAELMDWPKRLYAKLGFDEIGRLWSFSRPPGSRPPGSRPPGKGV